MGRRKEGLGASLLCDFTISSCSTDPGLQSKSRNRVVGSAATIALQCVVNAWWALVAGLEGGGQGEVLELGKERRRRHP